MAIISIYIIIILYYLNMYLCVPVLFHGSGLREYVGDCGDVGQWRHLPHHRRPGDLIRPHILIFVDCSWMFWSNQVGIDFIWLNRRSGAETGFGTRRPLTDALVRNVRLFRTVCLHGTWLIIHRFERKWRWWWWLIAGYVGGFTGQVRRVRRIASRHSERDGHRPVVASARHLR